MQVWPESLVYCVSPRFSSGPEQSMLRKMQQKPNSRKLRPLRLPMPPPPPRTRFASGRTESLSLIPPENCFGPSLSRSPPSHRPAGSFCSRASLPQTRKPSYLLKRRRIRNRPYGSSRISLRLYQELFIIRTKYSTTLPATDSRIAIVLDGYSAYMP